MILSDLEYESTYKEMRTIIIMCAKFHQRKKLYINKKNNVVIYSIWLKVMSRYKLYVSRCIYYDYFVHKCLYNSIFHISIEIQYDIFYKVIYKFIYNTLNMHIYFIIASLDIINLT